MKTKYNLEHKITEAGRNYQPEPSEDTWHAIRAKLNEDVGVKRLPSFSKWSIAANFSMVMIAIFGAALYLNRNNSDFLMYSNSHHPLKMEELVLTGDAGIYSKSSILLMHRAYK